MKKEFEHLQPREVADLLRTSASAGPRIEIDSECVEQDLARLVLGIMEFLRQIMEMRAIERLESGRLSPEQEENLGDALMKAETAIQDVAQKFGLQPCDLSLDLGPLGRTTA